MMIELKASELRVGMEVITRPDGNPHKELRLIVEEVGPVAIFLEDGSDGHLMLWVRDNRLFDGVDQRIHLFAAPGISIGADSSSPESTPS